MNRNRGIIAAYILASARNGTLYTEVTSNLVHRIAQHKNGDFEGFSKRYGCKLLVWFEQFDTLDPAIRREKQLKRWLRAWKLKLIETENPMWRDLADDFLEGWDELAALHPDPLKPL